MGQRHSRSGRPFREGEVNARTAPNHRGGGVLGGIAHGGNTEPGDFREALHIRRRDLLPAFTAGDS